MSDEPEFEEDYVAIEPHMEVLPPEKVVRAGVGMKTVLLLSVLAAIAGAFGGAAIAEAIRIKTGNPAAEVQSQIESFSVQNSTLQKDVSAIEEKIKTLSSQKPQELDSLETRLQKLEERPAADNDMDGFADIGARIEALEQSTPKVSLDGEVSGDILGRLEALEQQQSPAALNEIADRLDRLEVQSLQAKKEPSDDIVVTGSRPSDAVRSSAPVVFLPSLPRAEILRAVAEKDKKSQGWVQRTFNRHVQVREAGELSPEDILGQIQAHLDEAEYREAVTAFDTLPPEARKAGQAWRDAMAAELEKTP